MAALIVADLETFGRGRPDDDAAGIAILSYNVLLQRYMDEEDKAPLYAHVKSTARPWPTRLIRLQTLLRQASANIVCLQEVDASTFRRDFAAFCKERRYDHVLQAHGRKGSGTHHSNAILFDRNRFTLRWTHSRSRILIAAFVAAAAPNAPPIVVVNVHLEGDPAKEETRYNQIRNALEQLALQTEFHGAPTVIAGDFNARENSTVVQLLRSGAIEADHIDAASGAVVNHEPFAHQLELDEIYDGIVASDDPIVTFIMAPDHAIRIDFMFFTRRSLRVLRAMRALDAATLACLFKDDMIPNDQWPSDHVPIGAQFALVDHDTVTAAP